MFICRLALLLAAAFWLALLSLWLWSISVVVESIKNHQKMEKILLLIMLPPRWSSPKGLHSQFFIGASVSHVCMYWCCLFTWCVFIWRWKFALFRHTLWTQIWTAITIFCTLRKRRRRDASMCLFVYNAGLISCKWSLICKHPVNALLLSGHMSMTRMKRGKQR